MLAIMADHDIEGQVQLVLHLLTSPEWHTLWTELAVRVESFASLGLPAHTSDAALWRLCQTQQIILITSGSGRGLLPGWQEPASRQPMLRGLWMGVQDFLRDETHGFS